MKNSLNNVAIIGPLRLEPGTDPWKISSKKHHHKLDLFHVNFNLAPFSNFLSFMPLLSDQNETLSARFCCVAQERGAAAAGWAGLSFRCLRFSTVEFTVHYASCQYFFLDMSAHCLLRPLLSSSIISLRVHRFSGSKVYI